jgi:hypothetical protein
MIRIPAEKDLTFLKKQLLLFCLKTFQLFELFKPTCRERGFILERRHRRELDHQSDGVDEEVDCRLADDLDEEGVVDREVGLVDHCER